MLEKLKLVLAGWSFKTFLRKKLKQGIRAAISFALGHLTATALIQAGVTIDPVTLEKWIDGVLWVKVELAANILKVKLEKSDEWRWLSYFL